MKYKSSLLVLFTAIVCASVALPSFAQTGEVYSLNVVGFQKLAATSGLTMVSTPFQRDLRTIDDVIGVQLTAGKAQSASDQIVVWIATNQSYAKFWLRNTDLKWYTGGTSPQLATNIDVIDPNIGFWIQNIASTGKVVVVSGDVVDQNVVTNRLLPGLNMVSYPFSTSIDINNSKLTNGKAGKAQSASDQVVLWNPTVQAYDKYWLRNTDRKWYTGGTSPQLSSNVTIGGGKGFWYQNVDVTTFVWVEAKPYTL